MRRRSYSKATKYIIYLITIAFILIALILIGLYCYRPFENTKRELISSLDKNEVLIDYQVEENLAYTLISKKGNSEYGDFFALFERRDKGFKRIYENDFKELLPWKIEIADVDGDKNKEILIAVKKTTFFDKDMKNRMFIFNYEDDILVKKWTGSQIAGTWRDFYVGDLLSIPGNELIFTELVDDEKERISIYSWFDFGFLKIAESEDYHKIKDINIVGENDLEVAYYNEGSEKKKQEQTHRLKVIDGRLIVKED